ncbi:MAG: 3-deoxy-manno-octulosonate cytidylyltransferase [Candidatus Aureabacteria bacterium]|nr:3-deoxy-manno-octulosonate cytidylyltransferase [Candidatus Auribacterota bacterium]
MKKRSAVIPARLESTRLPGKLLLDLGGKSLIQRVFENARDFHLFDEIVIATDSQKIKETCEHFGARVLLTRCDHDSGTSRIAEIVGKLNGEIIVNIQGDEPFLKKQQVSQLIEDLEMSPSCEIATLVYPSKDSKASRDPHIVKTVRDHLNRALYFSRYPIPFNRDPKQNISWLHHLGIYAFRRSFLQKYSDLLPCPLEQNEKLEQLRFLANGYDILLVETHEKTIGIDTQQDYRTAVHYIKKRK